MQELLNVGVEIPKQLSPEALEVRRRLLALVAPLAAQVHTHTQTHTFIYECIYIHTHTYKYTHTHTYKYVFIHTRINI